MAEDKKSTVTINDEHSATEVTNEVPKTPETSNTEVTTEAPKAEATPKIEGTDANSKTEETPVSTPDTTPTPDPTPTPEKTDDNEEPWDDDEPITEDDLVDELFYHGGMAKNIAKEMIGKLKAATDTKLRASLINHIAWHIATGGPTNKINGGKGKALHKEDIVRVLNNIH